MPERTLYRGGPFARAEHGVVGNPSQCSEARAAAQHFEAWLPERQLMQKR